VAPGFSVRLGPVVLAIVQEVGQVLGAVKHAGPDPKETDAPGFTGSKESYTGHAQALGCLFLRK